MAKKTRSIDSMETLMQAVPQIIEKVNAEPTLAFRFAANPLFLAEELGYTLTADMHHYAARRVRFPTETYDRLQALEPQIWKLAGQRFDIDSDDALAQVLFEKLKLPAPDGVGKKPPTTKPTKSKSTSVKTPPVLQASDLERLRKFAKQLPARVIGHGHIDDPLEPLKGLHPIMEPLLEYRQLDASSARLAPRAVYNRIAQGEIKIPVTKLQLRWKPPQ